MISLRTFFITSLLLSASAVSLASAADDTAARRDIHILGRSAVTVTGATIKLEDIADVSSPNISDDEVVIALKKLEVGKSPEPGKNRAMDAMAVLDSLKAAKVDLEHLGYTFPRSMNVTRAGRQVSTEEVRAAIDAALSASKREAAIKQVQFDDTIQVPPGTATIEAHEIFSRTAGQVPFTITVRVDGEPDTLIKATAYVDEWREVPVATRPLVKGTVIEAEDVAMARLNTASIPKDATNMPTAIIGQATSGTIGFGETFPRSKLEVPPVVVAGSKVTLIVRTALLEATATGIAIESGATGENIKVRNDSSKKIVIGKVSEPGIVILGMKEES